MNWKQKSNFLSGVFGPVSVLHERPKEYIFAIPSLYYSDETGGLVSAIGRGRNLREAVCKLFDVLVEKAEEGETIVTHPHTSMSDEYTWNGKSFEKKPELWRTSRFGD